ncbi:MAG: MFS transporter [Alphaproteobacteria bacterium]|nr:MFS transporter [Alphaproteobacteria bacterium]
MGERLDRIPVGVAHRRVLALVAAGLFVDVYDQAMGGGIIAALLKTGWSDLRLNGVFLSATFLGLMVGAWAAGPVSDRFGRRAAYQLNLLVFGIGSLAAAASPSMFWLIALRFVMCIGLGAEIVVGGGMMVEFAPAASRGRIVAMLGFCSAFGAITASIGNYLITPSLGWRWMFVTGGVGALLVWLARRSIPESPRWLESQGRFAEAEAIIRQIEGDAYQACEPVGAHHAEVTAQVPIWVLFSPSVVKITMTSLVSNIVLMFTVWLFTGWIPSFLVKQGLSVSSSLGFVAIMSAGTLIGTVLGVFIIDKIDRRRAIIGGCVAAAIAGGIYPFSPSVEIAAAVGTVVMTALYFLLAVVYYVYLNELFPTAFRQRGIGFGNGVGRLALVVSPSLIVPVYEWGGITPILAVFAGALVVMSLVIATYGIETRGRSLETLSEGIRTR